MLMTSKSLLRSSPSARSHRGLPDDQRDLGLCWADVASVEVPSILRNDRRRKRKGRSEGADTTIVTPRKPLSRRGFSRPHPKDGNSLTPIGVHPNPSDAELTVFWRRQLSGQDTVDGLPRPATMLSGAEAKHDRRHERIAEYFQYLARNRTSPLREKSPDCTFLSINPEKVDDWRNGRRSLSMLLPAGDLEEAGPQRGPEVRRLRQNRALRARLLGTPTIFVARREIDTWNNHHAKVVFRVVLGQSQNDGSESHDWYKLCMKVDDETELFRQDPSTADYGLEANVRRHPLGATRRVQQRDSEGVWLRILQFCSSFQCMFFICGSGFECWVYFLQDAV